MTNLDKQIKSRERVVNHGEVFTSKKEVDNMLKLVQHEADRIESRFLEPACGTGNFLIEIYTRKLGIVEKKYKRSQLDFEKYSFLSTSSVYGIDLMEDNVIECRKRLYQKFLEIYNKLYKKKCNKEFEKVIFYILSKNIVTGDGLTMLQKDGSKIVFPEWNFVRGSLVKRRDYEYSELIPNEEERTKEISIENRSVFIPTSIKDYELVHYTKVIEYE